MTCNMCQKFDFDSLDTFRVIPPDGQNYSDGQTGGWGQTTPKQYPNRLVKQQTTLKIISVACKLLFFCAFLAIGLP